MEAYGAPSPAPISPQSSHGYDLAKGDLVKIFGLVITLFLIKKLANYFMRNQQAAAAELAGQATVQPPRLPPAEYPGETSLELAVV
jgi:hypothetical protein